MANLTVALWWPGIAYLNMRNSAGKISLLK